jgi:hypothetical protein
MKMKQRESRTIIVTCAPYPEYEEQPKDQSKCELVDCPHCSNKMWLSVNKKKLMDISIVSNDRVMLYCYRCIEKTILADPCKFHNAGKIMCND